jgi:hypothetical protein
MHRAAVPIIAAAVALGIAAPGAAWAGTGVHQHFSERPAVVGDPITVTAVGEGQTRRPSTVTVTMVTEGVAGPGQSMTCILGGRRWTATDLTCVFDRVRRGQTWRVRTSGVVNPDHPEYISAGGTATSRRGSVSFYCQDPVAGHVSTWRHEAHYPCH